MTYAIDTRTTNVLPNTGDQIALFTAGLVGEAGGILAELKKAVREGPAYPLYRRRLAEEVGDFLWYFVRLSETVELDLATLDDQATPAGEVELEIALRLAASVGRLAELPARGPADQPALRAALVDVWRLLNKLAGAARVVLTDAADENIRKTRSRWPNERTYLPLFDRDAPEECRLPRRLTMEFYEVEAPGRPQVRLRCHELNIGDRVSDNAYGDDGYRFHDVFHLAHAVHLGWSPVLRALLFRELRATGGGRVTLDLTEHRLVYDGPCAGTRPQLQLQGVALGAQPAQASP